MTSRKAAKSSPMEQPDKTTSRHMQTLDTLSNVADDQTHARSVPELLNHAASIDPDASAIVDTQADAEISYSALSGAVSDLAAALVAGTPKRQEQRRPRIGLVLPNGPRLTVALLASAIAGEATPFNPALTVAEFERYFSVTGVNVVVLSDTEDGPAAIAAAALDLPVLRLRNDFSILGVSGAEKVVPPDPDDIAMVLMTSGSTGVPKIVPLRHRNVCKSARDVAGSLELGTDDRCLVMWQQFHIGGLVDLLLAPLSVGGTIILTQGFNAAGFFDLRNRYAPTWFQGVPTSLGEILRYAESQNIANGSGSLRLIRSVAAALTPAVQTRLETFFDVPVIRTLGMTEAAPLITSTRLPPAVDKLGSVGRPCGPELCIFGEDGSAVETGVSGDIAIRGENVFPGYENDADANAAAFRDGWFFTGDRGHVDEDGDLFITGRVSEQINRGGYKIMPAEVEEALSRHADVREAAVFGVAHPTLGEDIAAAVVTKAGASITAGDLRDHLGNIVAPNKIPARIVIRETLPRNPVGKVDRLALALEISALTDDTSLLVPARDATEKLIADIWMRELELPEIGIRQDFMMIGGDSLSALRVIVAMEQAFGCPMPDEVVENLTTIEEVAAALSARDIRASDSSSKSAKVTEVPAGPRKIKIREIAETDVTEALGRVSGKSELDLTLRQMVVYRPPAEVESLLTGIPDQCVATADGISLFQRLRLRRRFNRKRDEILAEINNSATNVRLWTRKELTSAATLYFSPETPVWEKTLIVGFSGNGQGMSMEMYRFLSHLDPSRFDFAFLRDTAKTNLYLSGLPEMGESILKLGAWLEDFADAEGYAQRMVLGTSGGGLAALYTGLTYGWDRVIAMCPPRLSKHQGYAPLIEGLSDTNGGARPGVLIANGQYPSDMDAARQILEFIPFSERDFHPDCSKHNLLNFSRESGQLAALYARWFDTENVSP